VIADDRPVDVHLPENCPFGLMRLLPFQAGLAF